MDIPEINLPDTDYILVPPRTIFYPPVAEIPYLDPVLPVSYTHLTLPTIYSV